MMGLNWERYSNELGNLDLKKITTDLLGTEFKKLPEVDANYLMSMLDEILNLESIRNPETAAVALVATRNILLLTQIIGNMMWEIGDIKKNIIQIHETIKAIAGPKKEKSKIILPNSAS